MERTIDEDTQFKFKIKEQSDMRRSIFLNDLNNLNEIYLVSFQMVQIFQYDSKISWCRKFKTTSKPRILQTFHLF